MAHRLSTVDPDFEDRFAEIISVRRDQDEAVDDTVGLIIRDVRREGDKALVRLTREFDRFELTADALRVGAADIARACARVPARTLDALDLAARRIETFHARQLPQDDRYTDDSGVELGARWRPVEAVGLYVPGGRAAYPSSVLMNTLPAIVAGVTRLVMVVPTPGGELNPLVMAAADRVGVHEIYRIGGAQAVAALAYGTESIAPVDKIVGPGNAYVASAKRQVFGQVGIDLIAGPSEILVVADRGNDPEWTAVDLLSQAEHDPLAQAILLTDDRDYALAVEVAVESWLDKLPRAEIARASWLDFGVVIVVRDFDEAPRLIDRLAPEHLELAVADPETIASRVHNAGAIFMGYHTPEAIGDYVAGPNHVLPTSRAARFASGLGVLDFMKRTSVVRCLPRGLRKIGPAAVILAEAEGLGAHAESVRVRLDASDGE